MDQIKQGQTVRFLPCHQVGHLSGGLESWAMDPEDDGLDGFARWIGELDGLLGEVTAVETDETGTHVDLLLQDGEELWGITSQATEPVPNVVVLAARWAA